MTQCVAPTRRYRATPAGRCRAAAPRAPSAARKAETRDVIEALITVMHWHVTSSHYTNTITARACATSETVGRAYVCERRVGADVTQRDEELIDAGVGQPDGRRAAVQRRLQNSSSSVHSYRTTGTNVYTSAIAP